MQLLSTFSSKRIFHTLAFSSLLIATILLTSGCTINIYFMDAEPSVPVQEQQNETAKQPAEIPIVTDLKETQPLMTETPAPQSNPSDKKYVGSKNSNIYHFPDCEWAQKISPANQIWFSSPQEALSIGYSPCKVCKPPTQ